MKRLLGGLALLALLAVVAAAGTVGWAWQRLHQPFRGYDGDDRTVVIRPGKSATEILRQLEAAGVLRDAGLARLFLIHRLGDPPLLAGEYRFASPMSTPAVLDRLVRGRVVTYPLTLIEGLTFQESAQAIADAGFGDLDVLLAEMGRSDRIVDLDPEALNLEGYLYPDTYHFARGTPESEIVATLVNTFRRRWRDEVAPLLDGASGVRELVTLASIVEKETQRDDERGLVASVYSNRLRIGMGLYADPTLIYGKKLEGTWDGNLRRSDLRADSPYNTYLRPGLPPSPICSPSVDSMVAAARPAESDYFYFVSRNDGSHVFARTLAEHNRNVDVWQKQYWRRRWAEQRRQGTPTP